MQESILKELAEKLKDTNWFLIAGFAIEVYTNGLRKANDIDIVLQGSDIDLFAERLGTRAEKRLIDKKTFIVDDYGFVTSLNGQEIEATNGFPKKRVVEKTFDKLFAKRVRKPYLGTELFLAPLEEIIVSKAAMRRPKDIEDLKLLKNEKIDKRFLAELAKDWGEEASIFEVLRKAEYKV